MADTLYSGSFGFDLELEASYDLTNSTELRLRIKNPKGISTDRKLLVSDVLDSKRKNKIVYKVQQRDFPIPGLYRIQLFDIFENGRKPVTNIIKVRVEPSLDFLGN